MAMLIATPLSCPLRSRGAYSGAIIDALDYQDGANNQLLAIVENQPASAVTWDAENRVYTYDANGNLTSVTTDSAAGVDFIQYDDRNLPLLLVLAGGAEVIYQYNGDGQRICKRVDMLAPEHYIMDAALTVGVADSSLKYWNLLANGVAGRAEAGGGKYYYLKDHPSASSGHASAPRARLWTRPVWCGKVTTTIHSVCTCPAAA